MAITFKLIHNFKKSFSMKDVSPIYIRMYDDQTRKYLYSNTKIYVAGNEWNEKSHEIKKNKLGYVSQNLLLKKKLQEWQDIQTKYLLRNKPFNLTVIKQIISGEISTSFTDFIQKEIDTNVTKNKKTFQSHQITLNKLREYVGQINFNEFLIQKGTLRMTTIDNQHKHVQYYVNLSIKKGLMDANDDPYKQFKRDKGEPLPKDILDEKDIEKLEQLHFGKEFAHYEPIRDQFLFSLYTALRISDSKRLNMQYFFEEDNGWVIDNQRAFKTRKKIYLPLYHLFPDDTGQSKAVKLFLKYKRRDNELLFPQLTEPYINRCLKNIIHMAGITGKKVSFHTARHSFGTLMSKVVDPFTLKDLMQHSNLDTTMQYYHSSKKLIRQGLANGDWHKLSTAKDKKIIQMVS